MSNFRIMRNTFYRFQQFAWICLFFTVFTVSKAQTLIYQQNFNSLEEGMVIDSSSGQDSWKVTGTTKGFLSYAHHYGIHSGGQAIEGESLGVSFYDDDYLFENFGYQQSSCLYDTTFDLAVYRVISTSGYENISLQFDWKGSGENSGGNWVDFGQLGYSTTGGAPFTWLPNGGYSGNGIYHSQFSSQSITVNFPAEVANQPNFTVAFRSIANECGGTTPQFIVDNLRLNGNPILQDQILSVQNAFEGATYLDGSHTIPNNSPITLTSGNRTGYEVIGWTGTGSIPSFGEGGTIDVTIIEDSEISWNWIESKPKTIEFLNAGGNVQLTFDNSRFTVENPVFNIRHQGDLADEFQIEINSSSDFSGTSWMQSFTGNFPVNSPVNFVFDQGFTPVNETTYYVRARAKGISHGLWSDWTSYTYSFTHLTEMENPDWFQSTQAQFQSDELFYTTTQTSGEVQVITGSENAVENGSFENELIGWTEESNDEPVYYMTTNNRWATHEMYSLEMWNGSPMNNGYFAGDYISANQNIDLTGAAELKMSANYEGTGALNIEFRVYVAEPNLPQGEHGTLVYSWSPETNLTSKDVIIDLTNYHFSGEKKVKLMYFVKSQETGTPYLKLLNIDNVQTVPVTEGSILSTPIELNSVLEATAFETLSWNQTLGTGNLTLKIQEFTDGVWTDIPGYDAISVSGDGAKTWSLADMPVFEKIRLVGNLNGLDVRLQDWSVQFTTGNCMAETVWDGMAWSNGIPTDPTVKIVMNADFISDESNTLNHELIGCSLETLGDVEIRIASGFNLILENELVIDNALGANLIIESDANLLQINPVQNIGTITVKRNARVPSNQYNYWCSPVVDQILYDLYEFIPNNRVMTYNTDTDYFTILPKSGFPTSDFGVGYSIKGPSQNPDAPEITAEFVGIPQNESLEAEENRILLSTLGNGFNLIGNPYPSNLNLNQLYFANENQFYNDETEETPAFYFWDNTENEETNQQGSGYSGNNYAIYNPFSGGVAATGGDGMKKPNGIVKPGQGFIIKAAADATYLQLDNDMRTTSTQLIENGDEAVYYKNPEIHGARKKNGKFWLELVNPDGVHIQIAIGYFNEAENEFEKYDSPVFSESVSENIYSISKDDKILAIQGRKGPFLNSDVIPLGIKLAQNGKYKIKLEDRLGIFETQQSIYLHDKYDNSVFNLSEADFDFEGTPGEFTDRFEIVFKNENGLAADLAKNQIEIQKRENTISVISTLDKLETVEIYGLSGNLIFQKSQIGKKEFQIPTELLGKQIVFVKVSTVTGEMLKRTLYGN